jgi:hypothetical protein
LQGQHARGIGLGRKNLEPVAKILDQAMDCASDNSELAYASTMA